jgi:hypothetical protein
MTPEDFLAALGWPADRLGELGTASWSAPAADGMGKLSVGIARESAHIRAWIEHRGLDGAEPMLALAAAVEGNRATVVASQAGHPPDPLPAEDAIALFAHMRSGMGKLAFSSNGPLVLPARAQNNGAA